MFSPSDFLNMLKDNYSFLSANPGCTSNSHIFASVLQTLVLYQSLLKVVGTVFINFLTLPMWFMSQSFFLGPKLSKISNIINSTTSLAELSSHYSLSISSFLHKMSLVFSKAYLPLLHFEIHFSFTNFNLKITASKSPGVKKKLKTES